MDAPKDIPHLTGDRLLSKAGLHRLLDELDATVVTNPRTLYATPETRDLAAFSSEKWVAHLSEVASYVEMFR